ncbi:histone chaperone, partial [Catenaria anguillulae PL171]
MSYVTITDVKIANPIGPFLAPFAFEITLECIAELKDDLEFKVIYVSSPSNKAKDQVLEQVSVGPIPLGINRFTLEAPAPNPALIPTSDLLGCTVVSLQVSYMDCEFVRIGYLVNIEHPELVAAAAAATAAGLEPPTTLPGGQQPKADDLVRNILADKPRVTRFHLNWENPKDKYY